VYRYGLFMGLACCTPTHIHGKTCVKPTGILIPVKNTSAQYFRDSDKGEDSEVGRELVEECNYGNMILNHSRSGQYWTEDIDGVPYSSDREDA
jgi:hypothetical protein